MPKKCPPGVICFENVTIFIILCVIGILVYLYSRDMKPSSSSVTLIRENGQQGQGMGLFSRPKYSYSNLQNDILLNPYEAPLRDDRYFPSDSGDPRGVPINISTRAVDTTYRQIGILKKINGDSILPLMGRPLFTNRDKWNFYTMNENNIKLPVTFKQKSCTNEYGCDKLYDGDTVYVEGANEAYKVTIYENDVIRYIPFA